MQFLKKCLGSHSNKANGFATGSVYVPGADSVLVPGPDNSKTYGTEKPGIACTSGTCGTQTYDSSGTYSGGCVTGNCGSTDTAGSKAFASSGDCSSGGCGGSEYNRADGTAGTGFGGFKSTSGSYSSASSVAGSGIDLGPLAHFFGTKGGAAAKAGSYSSSGSGSYANSGSFASSKYISLLTLS